MKLVEALQDGKTLLWIPELGVGHVPAKAPEHLYDDAYFEEFARRGDTDIGRRLNEWRVQLVNETVGDAAFVLDIGIGDGAFIEARTGADGETLSPRTYGFDINPRGVAWLQERGLYRDPWLDAPLSVLTMWDSMEHLPSPESYFTPETEHVFVTMPMYEGPEDILESKHFKPGEHIWYFTDQGLCRMMAEQGFEHLSTYNDECTIGREGVKTYVFQRAISVRSSV